MLAEERHQKIIALLQQHGKVRIEDLHTLFPVSTETIRRDLSLLEKTRVLKKVHGGAILASRGMRESSFRVRYMQQLEQKQTIASFAASFIKEHDTIMLDASSTSFCLAEHIEPCKNMIIITNSLKILDVLAYSKAKIIGLGGELDSKVYAFIGVQTLATLENYHATHCFISCHGIDINFGIMDISPEEAAIKEKMISHSSIRYLIIDSNKFGKKGVIKIRGLESIDYIITDKKPSQEWIEYINAKATIRKLENKDPIKLVYSSFNEEESSSRISSVVVKETVDEESNIKQSIADLSNSDIACRYSAIDNIKKYISNGKLKCRQVKTEEVNNHIHTIYSFSPYSPALAAYNAWDAGLAVCGIVDHESVAGGEEIHMACEALGLGATVGCELRVNFYDTSLANKKINNPDTAGIAYIVIHGIGTSLLSQVDEFLIPIRHARANRCQQQAKKVSEIFRKHGLPIISFEDDVVPLSQFGKGGSITERHILFACAKKLIEHYGKGKKLLDKITSSLNIIPSPRIAKYLLDADNPHYEYDLLGVFKSHLLEQFYIVPNVDECYPVQRVVQFATDINAIPAYPYLGDINSGISGDKKIEKFEDDFLNELFDCLLQLGFMACTYMPPRNTLSQLSRLSALCKTYGFMELSGVDINTTRQEFLFRMPEQFTHLIDSAWALVAHETLLQTQSIEGIFSKDNKYSTYSIEERIKIYATLGKQSIDLEK